MTKYMDESHFKESLILAEEITELFKGRNVSICALAASFSFIAAVAEYDREMLISNRKLLKFIDGAKKIIFDEYKNDDS